MKRKTNELSMSYVYAKSGKFCRTFRRNDVSLGSVPGESFLSWNITSSLPPEPFVRSSFPWEQICRPDGSPFFLSYLWNIFFADADSMIDFFQIWTVNPLLFFLFWAIPSRSG